MSSCTVLRASTRACRTRLQLNSARHLSQQAQSASAATGTSSSHVGAGLAGGAAVLLGMYGYYHYSGTAAVVNTARQTMATAQQAKDKVMSATPSPKDALHLFKSLATPFVATIPGGSMGLDAAVNSLEGLLEKHGEEVEEIIKKSINDLKNAVGDGKDGAQKVVQVFEDMVTKVTSLAQGQIDQILEKNPEWKKALGGSVEELKKLGESRGPEARELATSTYSEAAKIVSTGGLNAKTLEAVQKLIKEKTEAVKKLATKTGGQAWEAASKAAGPALEKMPDVGKMLKEKLGSLGDIAGEENIKIVKDLYAELERIGKSGKSPEEMAKEAKKVVESKVGNLEELKKKATDAVEKGQDIAGEQSGKLVKYAAGIPGLGALSKIMGSGDLEQLKDLAEKHGQEAEKLLESTYDDIKEILAKKLAEAKKITKNAAGDVKKEAKDTSK